MKMVSRAVKFQLGLLLFGAVVAMTLPIQAQNGGEPLLFQSPDGGDLSSNLARLSSPVVKNNPQTPFSSIGGSLPDAAPLPLAVAPLISDTGKNNRKSWATMTPREILGLPTAGSIFQKPDQNNSSDDWKNFDSFGRSSKAQGSSRFGMTNDLSVNDPTLAARFSDSSDDSSNRTPNLISDSLSAIPRTLSQLYNNVPQRDDDRPVNDSFNANFWKDMNAATLSSPSSSDSSRQSNLNWFKQVIQPGSSSQIQSSSSYNSGSSGFFSSSPMTTSSSFNQPVVNPIGASYVPLSSGIATPSGLAPLPGITGQSQSSLQQQQQSLAAPSWAPQAPPWMSQEQQSIMPQRKF
ncbi:MAG TPA: hypothetical protein VHG89_11530 [Verrucomicrobiae bacterium]|nr:hypothetical protein [Verrucomicrobiae bacterium]